VHAPEVINGISAFRFVDGGVAVPAEQLQVVPRERDCRVGYIERRERHDMVHNLAGFVEPASQASFT